ncbi:UDP-N-acetylmuramoyl-tripeptide--D-alanyl-D-alanine ligase [Clostridium sp. BSD9I1]|uniref:UDP-N-acetylmuramoyl-tripeptide--D-alanyl-D- alanine ligase n=1 Tax=Clostridium sp. BSD9I1 TaxID=2003589 RepID=UPI0016479001|nr:UDP-N-acetylmuramoyl-tripeptide--D-alanyl-D-alanine ligase [Clostridium sp. BSD9I1]
MEYMNFDEIVTAVGGKVIVRGNAFDYDNISTDTRKIGEKSIFIALKGENFNGNNYIIEASNNGALVCIVDELNFKTEDLKEYTSIIKVDDTKKALLDLAEYYRTMLNIKIVGITGSTGKTSTKDLTHAALSGKFKVFKTEGNFNNEIGLPLMMFKLDNTYDIAVLEMGMNNLGEIHNMAKAAKPDIALITNVGITHIENLKTRENILKAKLEITNFFNNENTLILNADNDFLSEIEFNNFNVMKTGIENKKDLYAYNIMLNEKSISFTVREDSTGEEEDFYIEAPGKHNVLNALLAIACARKLGIEFKLIKQGFSNLKFTSMRLDIIKEERFTIVNDCYNASPDSMKAAIEVLMNINGDRKMVVLGSMKELGHKAYEAHKEVGIFSKLMGVNTLIAVGEFQDAYEEGFKEDISKRDIGEVIKVQDTDQAAKVLKEYLKKDDVVLVKASRAMRFEKIVEALRSN